MDPAEVAGAQPSTPPDDAKTPRWRRGWPVGLLAALTAGFYHQALLRPSGIISHAGSDIDILFLPRLLWQLDYVRRAGALPLWNPYDFCGLPTLGDWQSLVLYPPNYLAAVLPLNLFLNYTCVAHVLLFGLGVYLLARRLGLSRAGAVLAAAATEFASSTTGRVYAGHLTVWQTMAWCPFILYGLDRAMEEKGFRWPTVAALASALALAGGHPQWLFYTAWIAVGWVVVKMIRCGRKRVAPNLAALIAFACLVLALALVGLLGAVEFSQVLDLHGRGGEGFSAFLSLNGRDAFAVIAGNRPGFGSGHETWGYVGISVLTLAVCGVFGRRRGRTLALLGVAATALAFATGPTTPVYRLAVSLLPGFGLFRCPGRALFIYAAAVALAAGLTVDSLSRRKGAPLRAGIAGLIAGATVVIACGVLTAWRLPELFNPFALAGGAGALIAVALALAGRERAAWAAAVVAVVVDLGATGLQTVRARPFVLPEPTPVTRALRAAPPPFRVFTGRALKGFEPVEFALAGVETVNYSSNVYRLRHFEHLTGRWPETLHEHPRYLEMLNVRFVLVNKKLDLPYLTELAHEKRGPVEGWLYRFERAMPRVWAVGQAAPVAVPLYMPFNAPDPRQVALVDPVAPALDTALAFTPARITSYLPGRIEAVIETDAPGFLVISEMYHPAWRLRIDGEPARVWRTDIALVGARIGAGRHRVRLDFKPDYLPKAVAASILALCLAVFLIVYPWRTRRTRESKRT